MSTKNFAVLSELYQQSNEHLRETDRKRDQVIAFFITIVAIFFNSVEDLQEKSIYFGFSLGILGVILSFVLTTYRKWHQLYVDSNIVLQYLMLKDLPPTIKNIETAQEKMIINPNYIKAQKETRSFFLLSSEKLLFISYLLISFVPFYVVKINATLLILLHILYIPLMYEFCEKILLRELEAGYKPNWILRIEKKQ